MDREILNIVIFAAIVFLLILLFGVVARSRVVSTQALEGQSTALEGQAKALAMEERSLAISEELLKLHRETNDLLQQLVDRTGQPRTG